MGLYRRIRQELSLLKRNIQIVYAKRCQKKQIAKLSGKASIKVAFILIYSSNFKYESVYKEFNERKGYESIVIICPSIRQREKEMREEMEKAIEVCKEIGYDYFETWDSEKKVFN